MSIWALGSVSFLLKISSVIIYSLSPIFVTQVLGASTFAVGLLEAFIEGVALLTRIFAGILSDFMHRRKLIIALGCLFAFVSRPLLALATNMGGVILGRAFDSIGNGLDAPPRDALVGDLAPPQIKGACYGLRESLARAGSFFGSLIAIGLLWHTHNNYSFIFLLVSIPILLALLVLILFVKDPINEKFQHKKTRKDFKFKDILRDTLLLPSSFWLILFLSGCFMMANFSGAFLILRAEQTGLDIHLTPLVMVIQNFGTTSTAYPVGYLSDKVGRRSMMALGIFLVIASNLILGMGESSYMILGGVLLWGAQMGITTSILAVFLADSCPETVRGTGFGLFHLINGGCLIIANTLAGWVWSVAGSPQMFYTSALIALFSGLILPFIPKKRV